MKNDKKKRRNGKRRDGTGTWKNGSNNHVKKADPNRPKSQYTNTEKLKNTEIPVDSFHAAISVLKNKGATFLEASPSLILGTNRAVPARVRFYIDEKVSCGKCPAMWIPLAKAENREITDSANLMTPAGKRAKLLGFTLAFDFSDEYQKTKEEIEKIVKTRNDFFYLWAIGLKV